VELDPQVAAQPETARKLVEVCPVNIFELAPEGGARVVPENEDECVLCDLCLQASPPGGLRIVKLYET